MTDLLDDIARYVLQARGEFVTRVAIDGADGAGKTRFAASLAHRLDAWGVGVMRASVDGFHQPRAVRYRRGRYSAEGFYSDSYDYPALKRLLLDPLSPGGAGKYVSAAFDHVTDRRVSVEPRLARPGMCSCSMVSSLTAQN
ncbi:nucleoside/nucleotide kinase family protein [Halopseudomonas xinjiangensis]|uniref:hypothetical protein n=1 Tax=Halopseudomonas xinjiangensis TaxID=487184 RepID=UPI000AD99AA6|nr:hypothetical protein [Halopseudomonas xinjiangensis]